MKRSSRTIYFNLSHAGQLVLYAFSWGRQVGIDVECIRPMEELDLVAEAIFSPGEYGRFRKISEKDRLRAFYHCWTRKEAFIKAVGEGLSFPLQDFEVSFEPGERAELVSIQGSLEKASQWAMHDLKACCGYAAALIVEGRDHSITYKQSAYSETANREMNKF